MKAKYSPNKRDQQPADIKSPEVAGRNWFWISVKSAIILAVFFGFVVIVSRYLSTPALMDAYPDWVSMQFNLVLVFLLVLMGLILALLASLALNVWQKNKALRKNLKDESNRRKEVEKDLLRAREMSRTGSWVLESDGRAMRCSDEICQILDCRPGKESMTLQYFLKYVHPDDRIFVRNEIHKALSQGTAFNLTHRIACRDGSIKIVKQHSEVYLGSNGKPAQVMGILQDITPLKEAESLAERLGRILDRSFNEIYTFDAETLKFTKVNLAARLNLRYNKEELCEMTLEDLLPDFAWDQVHQLIDSLKSGVESVTAFESVYKRKDGTTYPVDIRLQLLKDELCPQFVAIVQDITDRKKVETLFSKAYQEMDKRVEERTSELMKVNKELCMEVDEHKTAIEILGASERRLIRIMNNVVDSIVTIDEAGTILSFNRAAERLFGFRIEETLGQNIDLLMSGAHGAGDDEYFKNLLQSKKSAELGLRRVVSARKKDGTIFSAELAVQETVIGNQRMFTGLIRNLTEKMEVEQQLMQILKPMTKS